MGDIMAVIRSCGPLFMVWNILPWPLIPQRGLFSMPVLPAGDTHDAALLRYKTMQGSQGRRPRGPAEPSIEAGRVPVLLHDDGRTRTPGRRCARVFLCAALGIVAVIVFCGTSEPAA